MSSLVRVVPNNFDGVNPLSGDVVDAAFIASLYDSIENAFRQATSYIPSWGNGGTANTLGNGTLTGSYFQIGTMVFAQLVLTWGSTTVSGSAGWTFTIPVATIAGAGPGNGLVRTLAVDSSAGAVYTGTLISGSSSLVNPFTLASPMVAYSPASPFTWATSDSLTVTFVYFTS